MRTTTRGAHTRPVFSARLRVLGPLPLLLGLIATPASATIDVTGDWDLGYSSPAFGYFGRLVSFSQTGTALSMPDDVFTGTIDPDTGVFSLTGMRHCWSLSNPTGEFFPVAMEGTFSADGNSMTGTFDEVSSDSPHACLFASGTLFATRYVPTTTVTTTSSSTVTTSTTSTSTSVTTSTTSTTLPSTLLSLRTLRLTDSATATRRRIVQLTAKNAGAPSSCAP